MKVIVTGGAGFLGKHLCRSLSQAGHEVRVIDLRENDEFPTVIADVRDQEAMLREVKDAEVVFHLAALIEAGESVKKPHDFVANNITGSLNVLEAMRENGIKTFIFSSTAAVYGEPKTTPITEENLTQPISPYGVTKLAMEGMISSYAYNFGITGIALRYFNLYGPEEHHEPESHAIPRFISQIKNGEEVTVWGSGEHVRDYIYVQDVVDAHLNAIEFAAKNPGAFNYFNLSTGKGTEVIEIINLLSAAIGKPAQIKHFPARAGDPLVLYASPQKANQEMGWKAQVEIEEGIKRTVDYFLKPAPARDNEEKS